MKRSAALVGGGLVSLVVGYRLGQFYAERWFRHSHLDRFEKLLIIFVDSFESEGGSTYARIAYEHTVAVYQSGRLYAYAGYLERSLAPFDENMYETEIALVFDLNKRTREPLYVTSENNINSFFTMNRDYTTRYKLVVDVDEHNPSLLEIVNFLIHRKILSL